MARTSVYVEVEVDLSDFSDDDIKVEFENRDLELPTQGEFDEMVNEMYYAFKLGRNDHAIELAKKIACHRKGAIL